MKVIKAGSMFYSYYYKRNGIVTKYIDKDNWWFQLDLGFLTKVFGMKSPVYKAKCKVNEVRWL